MKFILPSLFIIYTVFACGGKNTSSNVESPGKEKTGKDKALEIGADLLQDKKPLKALNMYLNGFHFYNGNMKGQMEAHHYCHQVNDELIQCIIYDGNDADAKIMGIEYIVSERIFKSLPQEERKLWHSHRYEVKSGSLIAPGIPQAAEHELMEKLVTTYGKTFHTWHTDKDLVLPMGHPMVMMGFTEEGQLEDSLLTQRDQRFGISTAEKKQNREDIPVSPILPGADAWKKNQIKQLTITDDYKGVLSHH
ncbi:hypothetical protein BWI96_19405 [Siphonobacter sp. SORGH_AS_0500]|uniref:OBAP family protein n=1 Tax=Siphonobacter sp. SORGH_AS_0500 TaxID=1864824 RepID=UPI000CA90692|nr:OBAP family protein [Siphonobacter sp. SORGH_AS_0500]PKK34999.1 hypothetical protein BWI96_19405 [Siphonobacter sp. SORGH_AS_0500]